MLARVIILNDQVPHDNYYLLALIPKYFGRSLAFDGYDSTCAAPEAAEFIEKLVLPVNNKRDDNSSYSKDLIAKSFGLGFANYGFYYPERNLTLNDIDKLTQSITAHLEETRIL